MCSKKYLSIYLNQQQHDDLSPEIFRPAYLNVRAVTESEMNQAPRNYQNVSVLGDTSLIGPYM